MNTDAVEYRITNILLNDKPLLSRMKFAYEMNLPQWWFAGGCIYQSIWNSVCGFHSGYGIMDYDLIFFDPNDCTEALEMLINEKFMFLRSDGAAPVRSKNQARIKSLFLKKYGLEIKDLSSSLDGLKKFLSPLHAVAARLVEDRIVLEAPFGWDDVLSQTVRPNYLAAAQTDYDAKADSLARRWPNVKIIPWTTRAGRQHD